MQSVTLHTNLGDIKVELFCEQAPKTCEVRTAFGRLVMLSRTSSHCALATTTMAQNFTGKYVMKGAVLTCLRRNIKGFMIQGGDPTGAFR